MRFSLADMIVPILIGVVLAALALALALAIADVERNADQARAKASAEELRADFAAASGRQESDLEHLLGLALGSSGEAGALQAGIRRELANEGDRALAVWRTGAGQPQRLAVGGTFALAAPARKLVRDARPGAGLSLVAGAPGDNRVLYALAERSGGTTYAAVVESSLPVTTLASPFREAGGAGQIWVGSPGSGNPVFSSSDQDRAREAAADTTLNIGDTTVAVVVLEERTLPLIAILVAVVGVLLAIGLALTGVLIGRSAEKNALLSSQNRNLTGRVRRSEEEQEASEREAERDPLTGLPNRGVITRHLEQSVVRARRTKEVSALFFVDLDGFKAINDTLGHQAGDELLVSVAKRLDAGFRGNDTVARFAGDEFCVLCEGVTDGGAAACLKIERILAEPVYFDGSPLKTKASIGMALAGSTTTDAEEVLRQADAAMYRAKESGGGRVELAIPDAALDDSVPASSSAENESL